MNLFGSNRSSSSTPNNKKQRRDERERERYLHNLSKGDHVVRWDRIVVYPIQVHGIVLSASDDVVTIVDFGLTATPPPSPPSVEHKGHGKFSSSSSSVENGTSNESNMNSSDSSLPLEEMINHEDRAMIKTCESHRHEIMGPDRINILVLTEEKDIKSWKKVNYTIEKKKKKKKKQGKFQWWWDHDNDNDNGNDNTDNANGKSGNKEKDDNGENIKMGTSTSISTSTATSESKDSDDIIKENCSYEFSGSNADDGAAIAVPPSEEEGKEMQNKSGDAITGTNSQETENSSNGDDTTTNNNNINSNDKDTSSIQEHNAKKAKTTESHPTVTATSTNTITINKSKNKNNKDLPEPLLTRSDPTTIVLARVRYLVSNPHVLPPHHIFYSNSECIAVWCKTGVWSTLQASIYLHSTAAGNFKSAVTAAAAVSGSTVTTTVPATGIGGWFGMTTTATVSLVSVQPWIIPALAGYGIIAVGGPYIVLRKCHEHWRRATTDLNDKFWSELDADVYVEAIKSWSGLD